jgi:aminoglycoside/choline kinase family phosphotransferase
LRPASSDASFRRYFRADREGGGSVIVMDAPPPQEDVRPFVHVAGLISAAGLHAPRVLAADTERGFLLLDDLGSDLYLQALQAAQASGDLRSRRPPDARRDRRPRRPGSSRCRRSAAAVRRRAAAPRARALSRLVRDARMRRHLERAEQATWDEACDQLVAAALAQPVVAVHRDWMPRNLMVADPNPGILDFQDAGRRADRLRRRVAAARRVHLVGGGAGARLGDPLLGDGAQGELPVPADFGELWRSVEWIGLQRHLKVLGIFSRLKHRDGKPAYSQDLPRFFAYAHKVATRYSSLASRSPACSSR